MSNNNKPRFSLPNIGAAVAAAVSAPPASNPPSGARKLPDDFVAVLDRLPLPWVVGPTDSDDAYMIFVASDIKPVTDDSRANEFGTVFKGWEATCAQPRFVVSLAVTKDMADLFVFAANGLR